MPTIVTMPKWGLTMVSGTVTGWSREEGDAVTEGAPLLTVETEKAVDDIEAPATGILRKIVASTGSEVPVMGAVAIITAPDEELSDDDLAGLLATTVTPGIGAGAIGAAATRPAREARQAVRDASGRFNASPAARKRAGELGVDLTLVEATGSNGRITSEDVERAAAESTVAAAAPRLERIELANGITLSSLVAGPSDAPETMLFVHGLGGSQSTWATVLVDFAGAYRIAAIDLPGHGNSDKPDSASFDYSLGALATAVGEVIEKLELAPTVVVGHSLGGATALQIALDRPKLVRGLVLIDSAALGAEISPILLDRIESEPSREEARQLLELFFEDRRFVLDRGVEEMYVARGAPGADQAMKAIADAVFSREGQKLLLIDRLSELHQPVLFIAGELDRVIPASHSAAAAESLPTSWLEVLPGVGHVPQIEASSSFVKIVNRWLASLPRP